MRIIKSHNRIRSLITIITAAVLVMSSSLIYVQAYSGLDEYVALGVIGHKDDAKTRKGSAAAEDTEPLAEAGPETFAEALAQEYRPIDGTYILTDVSRFYIITEEDEAPPADLLATVELASSQFASYRIPVKKPLAIVYGPAKNAQPGDIVISLVSEDDFLYGIKTADINESYRIDIYETAAVEACSTDGIWYGLTELMEIAREKQLAAAAGKKASDDQMPAVIFDRMRIKDGPDMKERALMLDCGRKYYSKEWIENLIRRASLQRYNALILHFAEAEGIRIDSEVFPWMTSDIKSLSTDEVREIVKTAHKYHMDVIPSFDTPGHNTFMVKRYAEYVSKHPKFKFKYDGKTYNKKTKGFKSIANHYSYGGETRKADYIGIDLTQEHSVAFANALIEGYADFFRELGCTQFDIGSDELLGWYTFDLGGKTISYDNRWSALEHWKKYARETLGIEKGSASDVLISYINDFAERLEKKGYTCRVFNDEIDINKDQHVELRKSIEITYWFDAYHDAGHYAEKGHMMHNFMESWCFYVLRKDRGRDIMDGKYKTVNARNIFENWNPRSFARKAGDKMTVPKSRLAGGYFAIWCDHPDYKDMETVWDETAMKTWANASRMWNAEVNSDRSGIRSGVSYEDMKKFALRMKGFPGFTGDCEEEAKLPAASDAAEETKLFGSLLSD